MAGSQRSTAMRDSDGTVQEPASLDLTVLICTYNRANELDSAIESAVAQEAEGLSYEVLVVDNNSTDRTQSVVEGWIARAGARVRLLSEPRQGKPYALNAGIAAARGAICAIIDDDQVLPPDYAARLLEAFRSRPDVTFVGGRVLPLWEAEPPEWLTREHWSPIGMLDYGDEEFRITGEMRRCLVTCAFRTAALREIGGFDSKMFVSEDAEIQERLIDSGDSGLYLPHLTIYHRAPASRTSRRYFLRWHERHGRSRAIMRQSSVERARMRFLDVPSHLYTQAIRDLASFAAAVLRNDDAGRFRYATRLRFFWGFLLQRVSEHFGRDGGDDSGGSGRLIGDTRPQPF
jgi:glucosyl-dolichyl phosphate glucuronosyltransferase